jgi:hypothetical protein
MNRACGGLERGSKGLQGALPGHSLRGKHGRRGVAEAGDHGSRGWDVRGKRKRDSAVTFRPRNEPAFPGAPIPDLLPPGATMASSLAFLSACHFATCTLLGRAAPGLWGARRAGGRPPAPALDQPVQRGVCGRHPDQGFAGAGPDYRDSSSGAAARASCRPSESRAERALPVELALEERDRRVGVAAPDRRRGRRARGRGVEPPLPARRRGVTERYEPGAPTASGAGASSWGG